MPDDHRKEFSRKLRHLMDVRGLNPKSLLFTMKDDSENTNKVYAWLSGDRLPSLESLYSLREALRCKWVELLGDDE